MEHEKTEKPNSRETSIIFKSQKGFLSKSDKTVNKLNVFKFFPPVFAMIFSSSQSL